MKEDLFKIFESIGFLGFSNNRFHFKNWSTTSESKFINNVRPLLESYPSLALLEIAILKKVPIFSNTDFASSVQEWTKDHYQGTDALVNTGIGRITTQAKSKLINMVPIINLSTKSSQKLFLYDPNTNKLDLNADPEMYQFLTGTSIQTLIKSDLVRSVYIEFNPYMTSNFYLKDDIEYLNLYNAPKWQLMDCEPKYGGMIKNLIEHLFPNDNDREYVLDWFHHSLTSRCETVLCLIGARGTGKGILLSSIAEALHSTDYFQIAKQDVLTDKFNGEFKNKRNIFFDEVDISGDKEVAKFKALANAKIAMERKGENSETIDNYVSMTLASNYKDKFRVEPQDRRFSTPRITNTPLNKVMKEKEISEFIESLKEEDNLEIAQFGKYLLSRIPKYSRHEPLKNDYFFELCRLSMPAWKLFVIDYLIDNCKDDSPILTKTIKKKFEAEFTEGASFPVKKGSFDTFLDDYLHEGRYRIGSMVQMKDSTYRLRPAIKPNKEFLEKYGSVYGQIDEDENFDLGLDSL